MDASLSLPILVGLIAVALLFDFLNGLHDAANSIATIVSTRVLRPQYAVLWAAFFNFVAFAVFGLHVANTIGTGIIEPHLIDAPVIFGALITASLLNGMNLLGLTPEAKYIARGIVLALAVWLDVRLSKS